MNNAQPVYDIAVIGAGVVGAAIARELSRYQLSCALLEAGPDVGMGTSKANTAIWHTGFDTKPGTLESRLLRRSHALLTAYVDEAGIPVERLGAILIAWNGEQLAALPGILDSAHQNGVTDVRHMPAAEIEQREPHINVGALGGLYVPGEAIFCPFTLPLALATQAVSNGVALQLNFPVTQIERQGDATYLLHAPAGRLRCRYLVNAAGLYADQIDRMLGHAEFTVRPRRGELIVFDKFARALVNHILLPVPSAVTKGVLISPTVYGNVMLGPTAEDLDDKTATNTSAEGLEALWHKGAALMPELLKEEVVSTYAGLRAATEHADYQVIFHPAERYVCVGGIRSTGLTASMAIAEYVVEGLRDAGLQLVSSDAFRSVRMPNIGEAFLRPYQSAERIAADPDCGRIVCHCERVTTAEIRAATCAPLPARSLDGVRRRTRALLGRCQGFYCAAAVARLLAEANGQSVAAILGVDDAR